MTIAVLVAWLLSLPLLLTSYGSGAPIPFHERSAQAIARAVIDTEDPKRWAAKLHVWGAYESGNADADAAGGCPGVAIGTLCKREQGARYCGPWMVSCDRVPRSATLTEQARIAVTRFREPAAYCPAHPFGIYSGVGCNSWRVVDLRVAAINRELAIPLPVISEDP